MSRQSSAITIGPLQSRPKWREESMLFRIVRIETMPSDECRTRRAWPKFSNTNGTLATQHILPPPNPPPILPYPPNRWCYSKLQIRHGKELKHSTCRSWATIFVHFQNAMVVAKQGVFARRMFKTQKAFASVGPRLVLGSARFCRWSFRFWGLWGFLLTYVVPTYLLRSLPLYPQFTNATVT